MTIRWSRSIRWDGRERTAERLYELLPQGSVISRGGTRSPRSGRELHIRLPKRGWRPVPRGAHVTVTVRVDRSR